MQDKVHPLPDQIDLLREQEIGQVLFYLAKLSLKVVKRPIGSECGLGRCSTK